MRQLLIVVLLGLSACGEASAPTKVTDADVLRYIEKQANTESGRKFDSYIYSHEDTPAPSFNLPEPAIADPTMWDWTHRTFLLHEKLLTYWSAPPDAPRFVASTTGTSASAIITTGQMTSLCIAGLPVNTVYFTGTSQ